MAVCRFLIEDVICRYGCVGKIVADRGELDAEEVEELFDRLGVKLSLTTAYKPTARAEARGRGTSRGEASGGEDKEQRVV